MDFEKLMQEAIDSAMVEGKFIHPETGEPLTEEQTQLVRVSLAIRQAILDENKREKVHTSVAVKALSFALGFLIAQLAKGPVEAVAATEMMFKRIKQAVIIALADRMLKEDK